MDLVSASLRPPAGATPALPRPQTLLALVRAVTLATFALSANTLPSRVLGAAALYVVGACVLGNLKPKWRSTDVAMLVAIVCADIAWCTAAFVYFGPPYSLPAVLYAALVSAVVASASGWTAIIVGLATACVYAATMLLVHHDAPLPLASAHLAVFHALVIGLTGTLSGCLAGQWRRLRRTRQTADRLSRMSHVPWQTAVRTGEDQAVLQVAAEAAVSMLDAQRAWIMVPASSEKGVFELVAWAGFEPPDRKDRLCRGDLGVLTRVLDSGAAILVAAQEHRRTPLSPLTSALSLGQLLAAPIGGDDGPLGVLVVTRDSEAAAFGEEDPAVLTLLGDTVSRVLQTAGLIRELHLSSTTDSLTGLNNHGTFLERLAEQVQRARESGGELSLVILDMDGFKEVNDTAGHWEGNRVLQALGNALRVACRDRDIIARCGGDEFAVILPGVGPAGATVVAERTARVMRDATVRPGLRRPITASWGIASYPYDGSTDEALFRAADDRLYEAKEAGGNHVAFDATVVGGEDGGSFVREVGETPTGELVLPLAQ
jgi:diguanylate cyclase (GGDEF)-like protein